LFNIKSVFPQSSTNYTFSYYNNGLLTDMTNAETILVSPDMYNSNGSNLYDIGFTFVFMGKAYNKFSVSPWGILKLGYNKVGSNIGYNFSFNLQVPLLAPFCNDLNSVSNQSTTGTTRIIKKLEGVEPYRILTV